MYTEKDKQQSWGENWGLKTNKQTTKGVGGGGGDENSYVQNHWEGRVNEPGWELINFPTKDRISRICYSKFIDLGYSQTHLQFQ